MKTAVIGGSGYAGGELLRLLATHPHFEVVAVTAHSNAGELITSIHPQLTSYRGRSFIDVNSLDMSALEIIFIALPHGQSGALVSTIPETIKIVDLGADFRLTDADQWKKYYGSEHAGTWCYAIPEIPGGRNEIKSASRVANPGCYATSVILGAVPALAVIDTNDITVVAASGTTGAGRSAKMNLIASEVMGSLTSYKFGGVHQHTPEIEQALSALCASNVKISFTPILAPMPRGILSTITARLTKSITTQEVYSLYTTAYNDEYFVDVLSPGYMPSSASLTGSNKTQIQVVVDTHTNRLIVSVALDNLGKGAAGQAIQNANLMCGFHEGSGLSLDGLGA